MPADRQFAFGAFRFDPRTGQLSCDSHQAKLTPRAAAVLAVLAERAQELVTKRELFEQVWRGIAVSDDALTSCILELRQALGDNARRPHYIETLHRRGYRLVVPANAIGDAPSMAPSLAPTSRLPDKPSVAVMPFESLCTHPNRHYLAEGIVKAITAALSRSRCYFVIARDSAAARKSHAEDLRNIRGEFGVAYRLEGSVQTADSRIRVILQLIETEGGAHVWSAQHDGRLDDIFDLQDRVAEKVAGALQSSIRTAEVERSRRRQPRHLGAYDYAMRAMPHVWALREEESGKAIELLDNALAIDPEYPLALSLAGWCHAQRSVYNWTDDVAASQALAGALADRVIEQSNDDPLILAVLGTVDTFVRNHGRARALLERAITLDPNAAWAWSRLGWIETYSDRPERAREHFQRAIRLSPLDPMNFNSHIGIGSAYEVAQDYDNAVAHYRWVVEARPQTAWNSRNMASALAGAGRMEEARQAYMLMLRSYPSLTGARLKQAMVFSPPTLDRMVGHLRTLGLPD